MHQKYQSINESIFYNSRLSNEDYTHKLL